MRSERRSEVRSSEWGVRSERQDGEGRRDEGTEARRERKKRGPVRRSLGEDGTRHCAFVIGHLSLVTAEGWRSATADLRFASTGGRRNGGSQSPRPGLKMTKGRGGGGLPRARAAGLLSGAPGGASQGWTDLLTSAHCAFAALREHAVGRLALACRLWPATAGLRLAARPVESPVATCNCGLSRSFTPQSELRTPHWPSGPFNPQSAIDPADATAYTFTAKIPYRIWYSDGL